MGYSSLQILFDYRKLVEQNDKYLTANCRFKLLECEMDNYKKRNISFNPNIVVTSEYYFTNFMRCKNISQKFHLVHMSNNEKCSIFDKFCRLSKKYPHTLFCLGTIFYLNKSNKYVISMPIFLNGKCIKEIIKYKIVELNKDSINTLLNCYKNKEEKFLIHHNSSNEIDFRDDKILFDICADANIKKDQKERGKNYIYIISSYALGGITIDKNIDSNIIVLLTDGLYNIYNNNTPMNDKEIRRLLIKKNDYMSFKNDPNINIISEKNNIYMININFKMDFKSIPTPLINKEIERIKKQNISSFLDFFNNTNKRKFFLIEKKKQIMKDNIEEIINSLLENEINDSKSKILNEIKEYITNDENFQKDDRDIILNKDIVKKFNEIYLTQNNTAKVLF
jgi:hypothetical protein